MIATAADDDFIALVRRMRAKQAEYFRTRDATVLREAKGLERRVDDWLTRDADKGKPSLFS